MNWFEIIKENKLVTQPVTYTKDKTEDPEQNEDERCKRKVIEKCKAAINYLDEMISRNLAVDKHSFHTPEQVAFSVERIPEEVCCIILEKLQSSINKKSAFDRFDDLSTVMDGIKVDGGWHKIHEQRENVVDDNWYVHVGFWSSGYSLNLNITVDTYDEKERDYYTWFYFSLDLTVVSSHFNKRRDVKANWLKENPELIERWWGRVSKYPNVVERLDENPELQKLLEEYKARDFSNIEEFIEQLWQEGMMDERDIISLAFDMFVEALK